MCPRDPGRHADWHLVERPAPVRPRFVGWLIAALVAFVVFYGGRSEAAAPTGLYSCYGDVHGSPGSACWGEGGPGSVYVAFADVVPTTLVLACVGATEPFDTDCWSGTGGAGVDTWKYFSEVSASDIIDTTPATMDWDYFRTGAEVIGFVALAGGGGSSGTDPPGYLIPALSVGDGARLAGVIGLLWALCWVGVLLRREILRSANR